MIVLDPPKQPAYDYESLAYFLSVWRGVEASAPWVGGGFAPCAPIHRLSVTSRQWDSADAVLDDSLEKSTAELLGACIDTLDAVDRCLITYAHCNMQFMWVASMEPQRAQDKYEAAMLKLALLARKEGIDV